MIPGDPACSTCGRPFPADLPSGGMPQCAPRLADPPKHAGISAATLYTEPSRKLVLAFKHGGKIGLAPLLARMIAARLPRRGDGAQPPLLVPVPLHRWRLWHRGYNQAALLARELSKQGKGKPAIDMLVRHKATPPLGGLGRKARRKTLSGAIRVNSRRRDQLKGRDVILVDDVLTSGATSYACVAILLKAGASSVRIACFARVLDEALPDVRRSSPPENITPEVS